MSKLLSVSTLLEEICKLIKKNSEFFENFKIAPEVPNSSKISKCVKNSAKISKLLKILLKFPNSSKISKLLKNFQLAEKCSKLSQIPIFLVIKDGNKMESAKLEDIVDPKYLYALPQKYANITSKIHREDGLLSAQMLNGIPEYDLGVNSKLKNIERTETAKRLMGTIILK